MKYKVTVYRTGYSSTTFVVDAESKKEAEEKAYECADNTVFNEHSYEYFADNFEEEKED
jgi:hypothetical protein